MKTTRSQLAHRAQIHAPAMNMQQIHAWWNEPESLAHTGLTVRELDGTLADHMRSLIRAELAVNRGLPGVASDELRAIIDLMLAQLETAPKRVLLWD
jgi:hypothetical protein